MDDLDTIDCATSQLYEWWKEGRKMPGYVEEMGKPYMNMLLDLGIDSNSITRPPSYTLHFMEAYKAKGCTLAGDILGPHGWAILQMYIARKSEETDHDQTT